MRIKEKKIKKRQRKAYLQINPDILYKDLDVSRFINYVMKNGKKTIAQKIVYDAFDLIKEKTKKEPLDIFKQAVKNASPLLEVKPRRIGGATYQVPMEVKEKRQKFLSMNWMIQATKKKKGKSMKDKLAEEIIASSNKEGEAVKKRENVHKMAEANKAFAHFAR